MMFNNIILSLIICLYTFILLNTMIYSVLIIFYLANCLFVIAILIRILSGLVIAMFIRILSGFVIAMFISIQNGLSKELSDSPLVRLPFSRKLNRNIFLFAEDIDSLMLALLFISSFLLFLSALTVTIRLHAFLILIFIQNLNHTKLTTILCQVCHSLRHAK